MCNYLYKPEKRTDKGWVQARTINWAVSNHWTGIRNWNKGMENEMEQ